MSTQASIQYFSNVDSMISECNKNTSVYKDECVFSMEAPDDKEGLYICLKTFLGIGPNYIDAYAKETESKLFLNFKIVKKYSEKKQNAGEPEKPKKLAIGVPGGFELPQDRYTIEEKWSLVRFPERHFLDIPCPPEKSTDASYLTALGLSSKLASAISHVQRCDSAILVAQRAEATVAWEAENVCPVSKFAEDLVQLDNGVKVPPSGHKCHKCDLTTNLWMNLSDGTICCGRRFWDGSGGNNHAIEHYEATGFPLAVKLGTITPDSAEVFSYAEDEMVRDPYLARHLAHFGIDVRSSRKTDATVAELEVAANERLGEWLTLTEADRSLCALYGPHLTGLVNLGNSCYVNSALQALFATDPFSRRYAQAHEAYVRRALTALGRHGSATAAGETAESFGLQMAKLGAALASGAYSFPPPVDNNDHKVGEIVPKEPGVRPRMFRHLIGLTNAEFAGKRQQDVQEFLVHLFELVEREVRHNGGANPLAALSFAVEDRLECGASHKVQYKERLERILCLPIPLEAATNIAEVAAYEQRKREAAEAKVAFKEDPVYLKIGLEACLSSWAAQETIRDFVSPVTGERTTALKSSRLATFPDLLCVQMLKFTLGENWVPRKLDVALQLDPQSTLEGGRPRPNWRLDLSALRAPGGLQPSEEAMPEEVPMDQSGTQNTGAPAAAPMADETVVRQLQEMGFSRNACVRACLATQSDPEMATNWLMEHLDDSDLNDPLPESSASATVGNEVPVDPQALGALLEMGIDENMARKALAKSNNNIEEALNLAFSGTLELDTIPATTTNANSSSSATSADPAALTKATVSDGDPSQYELIAFISHMGESTAAGHYVCHVKRSALREGTSDSSVKPSAEDEWVIFNDEKVCRSEAPPFQHAYLYFFRRRGHRSV